jgi:hypothetical protein
MIDIKMSSVALPRRQPRFAKRLTPGSIANAKNNETNSSNRKLDSWWNNSRATRAPRNPSQNTTMALGTHFGIALSLVLLISPTVLARPAVQSDPTTGTIEQ